MKIKLIALAVAALVSGAANAALVDTGVAAGTGYNGSLVFSVWDSASSYSLNLSPSIATATGTGVDGLNTVVADVTALGSVSFAASSALTNWLGNAAAAGLAVQWNVNALGSVPTSTTNKELLTTANVSILPAAPLNTQTKVAGTDLGAIFGGLNTGGMTATSNEAIIAAGTSGYANTYGTNLATLAFADAANLGQSMMMTMVGYKTSGAALSTYSPSGLTASVDTMGKLTIGAVAAVPEADSLAMLLAGLGAVAAMVRRRRNV